MTQETRKALKLICITHRIRLFIESRPYGLAALAMGLDGKSYGSFVSTSPDTENFGQELIEQLPGRVAQLEG